MEVTSLQAIISALMVYINTAMYITDSPIGAPEVRFLPQTQIAEKACGADKCGNVLGWFSNEDQTVYLKNTLDVKNNMEARGILLHELVHYVQYKRNIPALANDCLTWKAREVQAYNIQYNWLYENRVPIRTPAFNNALVGFESIRCPPATSDDPKPELSN